MLLRSFFFAVIVTSCVLRFVALDTAPPGFFSDEARSGAHALCLGQTGQDAAGLSWPAYSPAGSDVEHATVGALYASPWTFPLALWLRLAGSSPYAVRAASAAFGVGSIALMVLLMWRLFDLTIGLGAGVVLACMPIHFQLSRLAWDNTTVPFYLLLGMLGLVLASQSTATTRRGVWIGMAALGFALAAIVYPSQRLQVLGAFPFMVWQQQRGDRPLPRAALLGLGAAFSLFCLPLLHGLWSGFLLERMDATSIFAASWLRQWAGPRLGTVFDDSALYRGWTAVLAFAHNLFAHLDPRFLWFSGDKELRHSSQLVGELGPLEALALAAFCVRKFRSGAAHEVADTTLSSIARLQSSCIVGVVLGIVPSALTRDAPHALRMYGAVPFIAIWVTLELWRSWRALQPRWRTAAFVASAAALIGVQACFLHAYFTRYPQMARSRFEPAMSEQAQRTVSTGNWRGFVQSGRTSSERIQRGYFAMAMGHVPCGVVRDWSVVAASKR
ncbi:MAG TPA: glycosyltransferase family 39 protein [Polyangiales bacterium]